MTNELTDLNGARLWFAAANKRANDLRAERIDEIIKVEEKYATAIALADEDAADALLKWGAITFYESHGMGGLSEQITELCGALPEGVCHRCGANGMMDGVDKPCGFCGWNFDDGEDY